MILCCSSCLQCCPIYQIKLSIFFQGLGPSSIHLLKQLLCQLFVKRFHQSCVSVLTFYCSSSKVNIIFPKRLYHIGFKLRLIMKLKYLYIFKDTAVLLYCFRHKLNLTCFIDSESSSDLILDAISTPLNVQLYVFPSNT